MRRWLWPLFWFGLAWMSWDMWHWPASLPRAQQQGRSFHLRWKASPRCGPDCRLQLELPEVPLQLQVEGSARSYDLQLGPGRPLRQGWVHCRAHRYRGELILH